MDKHLLDLYTDYLISSFGHDHGHGLSALLGGTLSHDQISRFLTRQRLHLRRFVATGQTARPPDAKRRRRSHSSMTASKRNPIRDESELICWHWDHTVNRSVKGINLLTCLYYCQEVALPVAFELVKKPDLATDKKTGKPKRAWPKTKNEYLREMLAQCQKNQLPFRYVLNDTWFASAENMVYLKADAQERLCHAAQGEPQGLLVARKTIGGPLYASLLADSGSRTPLCLAGRRGLPAAAVSSRSLQTKTAVSGFVYLVTSDTTLSGANPDPLPKTVESRRVSQVAQEQSRLCQVADQDRAHPEQPYLRLPGGVCEDGASAHEDTAQPFCHERPTLSSRPGKCVPTTASAQRQKCSPA